MGPVWAYATVLQISSVTNIITVSYPGKGECADPVNEDAILEEEGGGVRPRAGIRSVS
jgi:hypothetical protein